MVAAFSRATGLGRTVEVLEHHGDRDVVPPRDGTAGPNTQSIVLERGITHELEFLQWVNSRSDPHIDLARNISVALVDERGQQALRYTLYNCRPLECASLPGLDKTDNAVAIERLVLHFERLERATA